MLEKERIRRKFSSEEKAAALKRHLVKGEAISAICEELRILPTQFYRWQHELFEHASAAFEVKGRSKRGEGNTRKLEQRVETLEAKLAHKDHVIASVTEEYVHLKKTLGEV